MLIFFTPWKQQKPFRFSDVFREYKNAILGCNGLKMMKKIYFSYFFYFLFFIYLSIYLFSLFYFYHFIFIFSYFYFIFILFYFYYHFYYFCYFILFIIFFGFFYYFIFIIFEIYIFYYFYCFYFMLKALFVLKKYQFSSWLFRHVWKWFDKKVKFNFKIYDVTYCSTNNNYTHISQYLKK